MSKRETMLELAERCEKATGPDKELDMLIDCALKGVEVVYPQEGEDRIESRDYKLLGWKYETGGFSPYGSYPPVTASLDAAMTLVDDELVAVVIREALDRLDECFNPLDNYLTKLRLFVCAAALRARAAMEADNG